MIAGRVEIYHNGSWGTICSDNWGVEDAMVACHELDMPFVRYVIMDVGNCIYGIQRNGFV